MITEISLFYSKNLAQYFLVEGTPCSKCGCDIEINAVVLHQKVARDNRMFYYCLQCYLARKRVFDPQVRLSQVITAVVMPVPDDAVPVFLGEMNLVSSKNMDVFDAASLPAPHVRDWCVVAHRGESWGGCSIGVEPELVGLDSFKDGLKLLEDLKAAEPIKKGEKLLGCDGK